MANSDGDSANNSDHNISDSESADLAKEDLNHKEKVNFNGLSAIKSQFENGGLASNNGSSSDDAVPAVSNGSGGGRDEETKKELFKLRQRMCLGRSASMKQVYESQVAANSNSASNSKPSSNTSSIERPRIKMNSMKEKFEKGDFTTENELEFKERLRREVDEELTVVHDCETAAKEAKNKFKQLEKSNSFQQQTNGIAKPTSNGDTPRSTPTHHPKVSTNQVKKSDSPIEVIKCSEPGQKEEVNININQQTLQERYRFFEQQLSSTEKEEKPISKPTDTPRRPIQIPKAIDDGVVETPNDQIKRDPNIIRSSDVIDDLPKNDIAKKMLNVFQQLEKSNSVTNVTKELNGAPRERPPKRCITPPKDFTVDNDDETDSAPVNGHQDIVRSSYKDNDVVPVEPEFTRNLKAKFENWANEVENENRKNSSTDLSDEIPQNDITKNLRSKFEAFKDDTPAETKVSRVKVNRFVAVQDKCSVCDKSLYPMEKLEFSNWKVHRHCFRCCHCSSLLRLENYTSSFNKFYCMAHFKQLFLKRGNYEEGFGEGKISSRKHERAVSADDKSSSEGDEGREPSAEAFGKEEILPEKVERSSNDFLPLKEDEITQSEEEFAEKELLMKVEEAESADQPPSKDEGREPSEEVLGKKELLPKNRKTLEDIF